MTPVVCLVTDRRRLANPTEEGVVAQVSAAAREGVHLVQIRERDLDGGPLLRLVRRCVDAVRTTGARVVVNDRLDVALAGGAHGVHLREGSMAAARVRTLTPPGFLVGRSVHTADEAEAVTAAGGIDYVLFGTVFPTVSKPNARTAGAAELSSVVAATVLPVLAVGGMTPEHAGDVAQTGAAGFAGIGLFTDTADRVPGDGSSRAWQRAALAFAQAPLEGEAR